MTRYMNRRNPPETDETTQTANRPPPQDADEAHAGETRSERSPSAVPVAAARPGSSPSPAPTTPVSDLTPAGPNPVSSPTKRRWGAHKDPSIPPPTAPPHLRNPGAPSDRGNTNPHEPKGWDIKPLHWVLLAAIALLALGLRLKDPLFSTILPAEDPYLHMERTWDLLQGQGVDDYPLGFMVLLAPFALLGDEVFYLVVRFVPPLFGAAAIVGLFFLGRRYMNPTGTFASCLLLAVMPEHIVRTNVMVPAALALAVLPFFFLLLLRFAEGQTKASKPMAAIGAALFIVHPWTLLLMLPPLFAFWLINLLQRKDKAMWSATGVSAGLFGAMAVLWMVWHGNVAGTMFSSASTRLGELVASPGSILPLPAYVDLPYMLTWAALALAILGGVYAVRERSPLSLLGLVWTVMLLPLAVIDWFGSGFIPHRTVAYLAVGVAILAGVAVSHLIQFVKPNEGNDRTKATLAALAVLAVLTVPSAVGTDPWYRLYDEDDYAAYAFLDQSAPELVMAGSWQAHTGYRALTGNPSEYNPDFFNDENFRAVTLKNHPGVVVLIDNYTHAAGTPTGFLEEENWQRLGKWDDIEAYTKG